MHKSRALVFFSIFRFLNYDFKLLNRCVLIYYMVRVIK